MFLIYCSRCDENVAPLLIPRLMDFPKFVLQKDLEKNPEWGKAVPKKTVMLMSICPKCKYKRAIAQTEEACEEAKYQISIWEESISNSL